MLIQNFLKSLTNLGKSNARRRLARPHDLSEQLESRTLLTGNVQVSLSGANAQITGDAGNNELEIIVDNGSIVVRGLNGTTINQGTTAFTLATGSTTFAGSLTASLGAGDDIATVGPGITFGGNVSIAGQGGADSLRARTGTYSGNLALMGGDGASSIVVDGATVSGNLSVDGQGAMVISITNSTVQSQLNVMAGRENSADSVVIKGTTVNQKTSITTGKGDDNVVLQNSHFNGQLSIHTGAGNDVVYIDSSTVDKMARIATQRGNDMLQVLNSSSFSKLLIYAGGLGKDGASIADNTTTHAVIRGSQKAKNFAPATIASRITAPTTGAIAVADALRNAAVPTLTVATTTATFAENAGASATTLTVTRTGPTTSDLAVTLASSNTAKATVPATITILAGQTTATATIAAVDNTLSDADAVVTLTASAAGLVTGTRNVTVTNNDAATLTLTANQTTVSEGAGATAVTYTVSRNTSDLSAPLTVTLDDGTSGRLTVGNTVVIPANQASITFPGAAIENTIVDGSTDVLVTATATGFANGTATVRVTDNEPATLMVTSNSATVAENAAAGALIYTVSRNTADTSAALTVNVSSGTPRLTLASGTVTIPVGQSSVTFIGTPDNNLLADGNVQAIVTAAATGFVTGTATVTVTDNDSELSITAAPGNVSESAAAESVTYTLSRNTVNVAQAPALTVNVSSGTPGRLTVANSTVTIPAGQASVTFRGSPVPNTAADGNASVVVTASAAGFTNGTASVTVNDDDSALTVTTTTPTIAENAATGAVKYRVARNSVDRTLPLTVNIVSGTPGRLTVTSASVTIPANAEFIEFTGSTVDTTTADGNATVVVTASAAGFTNGTVSVNVTDNEVRALTLTANQTAISESATAPAVTYTVRRNTADNTAALTVNLSSNTPLRLTVPANVIIPAGQESITFVGTPANNTTMDGNVAVIVTASVDGFTSSTATVTVNDNDAGTLALTASTPTVAEDAGAGVLRYTLTRTAADTSQPLTVNLAPGQTGYLSVADSVTIPAGQASFDFFVTPVNNEIVDGNVPVVLTATATGFDATTATVTVNNTDIPTLALTSSLTTVTENAGSGTVIYTVSRNTTANSLPLTVNLSSGTVSRLTVPGSVTILAGQTSVTFVGSPVNNTVTDGNAPVVVTAAATGFVNGTRTVTVNDDEVPTLALTANSASVFENAGSTALTYTVTRNTSDLTSALIVTLTSGTPVRLTVGSTVVIPIGQASATFNGAVVNNTAVDGNASVTVTAAATGFVNGTATVTVNDDDAGTLSLVPSVTTIAENASSAALTYTISRAGANNSQALIVNLVSSKPGNLTVPATVTIAANATSATFQGTPVIDGIVAGNIDVIVTASSSGFANTTATVAVTNVDTAALRVTATTTSVRENAGNAAPLYTVSRNTTDLTVPLTVALASGNAARLGVPTSVTIPVGQKTAVFRATPVNNNIADGNISVVVTASSTGLPDATTSVTVLDDEAAPAPPGLTATLSVSQLAETAPAESTFLTVTRPNSNTTLALVVDLTYSDASRVSGPATITIPVGGTQALVPISTIDNLAVDGNIDAHITATAAGFATGQATLRIIDNEVATLNLTTSASTVSETSGTLAGTVATSLASSTPIVVSLSYQVASVLTGPSFVVIPAGATSVPVSFTIVNGNVADGQVIAGISASAVGAVSDDTQVTVTDADSLALSATPDTADKVQSNGTIITRNALIEVTGTTVPGAEISIDSDGDGVFDDGTTTAGPDGVYFVDVSVTHTAANHGRNRIVVRAVDGPDAADTAVNVHRAVGTVVHFATNVGAYDVEMLDSEAGATVTNFLSYVTSGAYQNIFVHRANAGSQEFIQSGSFKVSNSQITPVVTTGTINGQFNPANGNVAGTLAMALTAAGPNSGTSGWFINSIDNSEAFDPGQYTVFGRVIGDGLNVVRQISDLSQANLNTLYSSSALAGVPLTAIPANTSLTGTVATASGSAIVTGTGTLFTTDLAIGDSVVLGNGRAFFVASIQSDTSLTLTQAATSTASGLAVRKDVVPSDAEFVVFSSIAEILDTL